MTELYQRAKALFAEAMTQPETERADWLRVHCGEDTTLLAEVQSLLAHVAPNEPVADRGEKPPIIDGYRLLRTLGRGGMGQVWLAERDDPDLQQRVAIKLLNVDLQADPDAQARFRIERQILASLDHPHIARLLEGGRQVGGAPYLVMEYVEGLPIDRYCEQRALGIGERVALLLKVAQAVQAAHRQLVIHRDLKPANVLVDQHGEPKLLDFGIAKLLDGSTAASALTATGTGMQRLTPRYAAPEQVRGEPVTLATDVYAFGVLAYELLSGRSPYGLDGSDGRPVPLHQLPALVCDLDPPPPSRVCEAAARGRLQGDLDAIVLRCLRKHPLERYPDLQAVAAELQAWQRGDPVQARHGDRLYRLRRSLWRHRVAATAALLIVLLTAGFVAQLSRQVELAAQQAAAAEAERAKAEQVTEFMVELFRNADPSKSLGAKLTVREALDRGVADLQGQLQDQPEVKSHLLRELATIYGELGDRERAVSLADEAVSLVEPWRESYPDAWLQALYVRAAKVDRVVRTDTSALPRAQHLVEQAIRLGRDSIERLGRSQLGLELAHRGEHELALAQLDQVATDLLAALDVTDLAEAQRLPVSAERHELLRELAMNSHNRCRSLIGLGQLGEAEQACQTAAVMKARLWPASDPLHITTQLSLAEIAGERGDLEAAIRAERAVLERSRAVYGPDHLRAVYAEVNLGTSLKQARQYEEAAALLEDALSRLEAQLGRDHPAYLLTLNNYA
ncbi:MAG: protein kinase, partial [Xanthomonadales bacterium]|nr:protein kinase [Xanthomonadales bacterium]